MNSTINSAPANKIKPGVEDMVPGTLVVIPRGRNIDLVEVGVLIGRRHQRMNEATPRPNCEGVTKQETDREAEGKCGYNDDRVHAAFLGREGQVGFRQRFTSASALLPHAVQWLTSRTGISAVAGVTPKKSTRLPLIVQAAVGTGSTIAQRSKGRVSSIYAAAFTGTGVGGMRSAAVMTTPFRLAASRTDACDFAGILF